MKDLSSLPHSVRQRLEQAQTLSSQGKGAEAQTFIRQAATELARADPALCTLVIGSFQGYTELSYVEIEQRMCFEKHSRSFLGVDLGTKYCPVTIVRTVEKHLKLR